MAARERAEDGLGSAAFTKKSIQPGRPKRGRPQSPRERGHAVNSEVITLHLGSSLTVTFYAGPLYLSPSFKSMLQAQSNYWLIKATLGFKTQKKGGGFSPFIWTGKCTSCHQWGQKMP